MIETIVVEKTNKYGVRVGGKQYNYSKKYSGQELAIGVGYEADIYTSEAGAKYINSVKSTIAPSSTTTQKTVDTATTVIAAQNQSVSEEPKQRSAYKERDFDREAKGKTLFGLYAALVGSPYLAGASDDNEFKERVRIIAADLFKDIFPS